MSKRNVKNSEGGPYSSNLFKKLWAKINDSGNYGQVNLPDDSQALSIKSDTDVISEREDEKSGVVTNSRLSFAPIGMKGKSKVTISTHLHASGSNAVESALGQFFELLLGKREVVSADRGASIVIADPFAVKAGLTLSTAGALLGVAGNYMTLTILNGGSSGSVAIAKTGADYVLTVYNDSTLEDVILALDADADLVCAADAIGDDSTDLMVDLMASRGIVSGDKLIATSGAAKGFLYTNELAPRNDMTLVVCSEKTGQVVSGFILDKMSIDIGDKLPTVKIEGMAKKTTLIGQAKLVADVTSATKLYVGSAVNQFKYDENAPSYVDVIAIDGITYKSKANKIMAVGTDGTGPYVLVTSNVTATTNDYVVFHEPENHSPVFKPLNGMNGTCKIDDVLFDEVTSIKWEYSNNHQVFDNLALEETIAGFDPSKEMTLKITVEALKRKQHMGLINKLRDAEVVTVPVHIVVGKSIGSKYSFFARAVAVKLPNLSSKNDEVQRVQFEMELVVLPETVDKAQVEVNQF